VLDKLIRHINVENVRATIPPTNYEDIFLSAGYRLKPGSAVFLDQLFTQDFLAYNTQSTSLNTAGVETFQHTRRQNSALSFRRNTAHTIFNAFVSYEKFKSQYRAAALDADPLALALDLAESGQRIQSGVDFSLDKSRSQYRVGASYGYRSNPNINLSQRNWNFLPPQSTSDNPYYYQASLNSLYSELSVGDRGEDLALYADYNRRWNSWRLMTGLRTQFNDYLVNSADVLARMTLTHEYNERQRLQLSLGSYAESPVRNLIDPYQILIRNNLSELKSEKTYLAKLTFTKQGDLNRKFSAALFAKRMTDLPALTPKFYSIRILSMRVYALGELRMQSNGTRLYSGFSVSYDDPALFAETFSERLQLRTSYAYTHSSEVVDDVTTALSEDAPHRFELDLGYDAGKRYEFGFQLFARSGYRYTEPSAPQAPVFGLPTVYTENSYTTELSQQNRERFPLNLNVNLSARRTFGAVLVYMNVGNVFNRANPLVRTFDNYVYDAGILPSIGAKYSF
jgi:hypothetical protein